MKVYDVVIVGAGIVGATAALALAKQTKLMIAVLDTNKISSDWHPEHHDHRVSAISFSSKKIFQHLGVWNAILKKRISPYTEMKVWDEQEKSEIQFNCRELNESALGFIIEDSVMRSSLLEEINKCPNVDLLFPHKLVSAVEMPDEKNLQLITESGMSLRTKLLIAADGANSIVRELFDIKLTTWDYEHTALVTSLTTELPHQQVARQKFLATGPLAFLPLKEGRRCSIVWSTSASHATELMAMDDAEFIRALQSAFGNELGDIYSIESRFHFPLRMRHVKNYVQSRVALIGDAAHTIHPLAGQGVNMGLLDAAALVEVLVDAIKLNRDFSSVLTLRRYERWRKSGNLALLTGVEIIKKLFATNNTSFQRIRQFGINLTNRTLIFKNFFANYALGKQGDIPAMAKQANLL